MQKKNSPRHSSTYENRGSFFLLGLMGSGKSFWADYIGKLLSIPVFHLDDVIRLEAALRVLITTWSG